MQVNGAKSYSNFESKKECDVWLSIVTCGEVLAANWSCFEV
jgi:hypothetical protein